jgi:pimeloyl-ACP methyl ester carboxylesterase
MEQRVYLIPGVATDRRVFAELHLPGYEKVYLDWMLPKANERIAAYAARMVARLDGDTSPVLVGYSFGGLIAQEMAKLLPEATVILISSIKSFRERPLGMWLTSSFSLHKLVPTEIGKEFGFAYKWMNDPQTPAEHAFIHLMKSDLDPVHTDWAIHQAVNWRHEAHTPRLFHIHGDQDRIFPIRYIRNCIPVRGGTHLMLLNKGEEIGAHIVRIMQALAHDRAGREANDDARHAYEVERG